jgi:argininosuccinate lyase / amino-acid N-acetyltransferase
VSAALTQAMERVGHRTRLAPGATVEVRAATLEDVPDICALINYWTAKGENLPRSEEDVIRSIGDFGVAEANGEIIGCASLLVYTSDLAEIRSLGVDPETHGGGAGSKLVDYFVERAQELRIPRVFVLTRAPAFFDRLGFHIASIDTLPEKVWKDCRMCPKQNCCDEVAMVREVALD